LFDAAVVVAVLVWLLTMMIRVQLLLVSLMSFWYFVIMLCNRQLKLGPDGDCITDYMTKHGREGWMVPGLHLLAAEILRRDTGLKLSALRQMSKIRVRPLI
jgi:hypothetical protein